MQLLLSLIRGLAPLLMLTLLGLVLTYERYYSFREAEVNRYQSFVLVKSNQVRTALAEMDGDLKLLSRLPSLNKCFESRCMTAELSATLNEDLQAFFEAYGQYTQLRVLSAQGLELLRWNYDPETGLFSRAMQLQDKSSRDYVQAAMQIPVGATYFSALDHNMENGEYELPLVPTVRALRKIEHLGVEYLVALNRDLSPSIAATVDRVSDDFDSNLKRPLLRVIYDRQRSTDLAALEPGSAPDSSPDWAPVLARQEQAQASSLESLPAAFKRIDPERLLTPGWTIKASSMGTLIVHVDALIPSQAGIGDPLIRVAAYLPDSYLAETFWRLYWGIALLLVLLFAALVWLMALQRRQNRELLVGELALKRSVTDLEASQKLLEERSDKQRQIFSIVSHELRTPLASIKMMSDDMNLKQVQPHGRDIDASVETLLSILDDMRTVMDPSKSRKSVEVVDSPYSIAERTLRSLKGLIDEKQIELHFTGDTSSSRPVKIHAQVVRQVLTNLVKNAAIHSKGTDIWVDLTGRAINPEQTEMTLTVQDNGVGIDSQKQKQLYEAFVRGNSDADGSGLGLYVVKTLADTLEADLRFFDSPQGGAGFQLRFNLDNYAAHTETVAPAPIDISLSGLDILFAEDQLTIQKLTCKQLEMQGCQVVGVLDGQLAMEAFKKRHFDLVLTDINMPNMNGFELTKALRDAGFDGLIIGVTAATEGEEMDKLLALGANAVLPKPITVRALKEGLAKIDL